jgi:hypothetical protein
MSSLFRDTSLRKHCKRIFTLFILIASFGQIGSAFAQNAASAKALIDSAFAEYRRPGKHLHPDEYYLTPSLRALVAEDSKLGNQINQEPYVGGGELICNCQEWEGIWVSKMTVKITSPGHAEINASFVLSKPPVSPDDSGSIRTMRYDLVFANGHWRIDDIATLDPPPEKWTGPTLRAAIKRDIQYLKNPPE